MSASGWLRFAFVLFVALVVQISILDQLVVLDAHPDVLVLFPVAAALLGGAERGFVLGFVTGLGADLLVSLPYGLSALSYVVLGFVAGLLGAMPSGMPSGGSRVVLCAIGGGVGTLIYALIAAAIGQVGMLGPHLLDSLLVVSAAGLVLSPIVLSSLSWVFRGSSRTALGPIPVGGSASG